MKPNRLKTALCSATLLAGLGYISAASASAPAAIRAEATRPVAFDVMMPLRNADKLEAFVAALHDPASPSFHHWLTPAQFGLRFGPSTAGVEAVAASLRARGFNVSVQTRSIHATGSAAQAEATFGTHLLLGRTPEGVTHIMQETPVQLPAEIAATGAHVLSFSPHVAHVHSRIISGPLNPNNRYSETGAYWFTDLKQAYAYPSVTSTVTAHDGTVKPYDGTGVTIGVLMSSDVLDSDIQAVFDHENWTTITGQPAPKLFGRVYVNGGATTASPAFDEASLDTQEELTGAPGAHVILYDIPDLSDGNTSAGYITLIEQNAVDLVSSSFGGCERFQSALYNGGQSYYGILDAEHELFLQGNAQGITFLASSGDSSGKSCPSPSYFKGAKTDFVPGIETPAADPNVTAVGGTNVVTGYTQGSLDSPYVAENGWIDPEIPYDPYGLGVKVVGGDWGAGSGYSYHFAKPAYQMLVDTGSTTRRAVPDVGMQVGGCPGGISKVNKTAPYCTGGNNPMNGNGNGQRSAVVVAVNAGQTGGGFFGFIGTSVASPEFAGATALLIERRGRMGNLNTYLYELAARQAAGKGTYFHTNIPGYNGIENTNLNSAYGLTAGVGTPIVTHYVGAPGNTVVSGTPQTPSNP